MKISRRHDWLPLLPRLGFIVALALAIIGCGSSSHAPGVMFEGRWSDGIALVAQISGATAPFDPISNGGTNAVSSVHLNSRAAQLLAATWSHSVSVTPV
ncbi:MAG: hypothetical protein QMB08_02115 [Acidimicrobiales bacterium]|jgi:hypothetical protein